MSLVQSALTKTRQFFSYLDIPPELIEIACEKDTLSVTVNLAPEDAGIFIGRYAATIDSLQLLLALFLRNDEIHHLHLDIGGYRERRLVSLKEIAARVAQSVLETGIPRALPPLSATERRQIHLLYHYHAELTTYSEGEGRDRRLFLAPKTV